MSELSEEDITFVPRGFVPGVEPTKGMSVTETERQFIKNNWQEMSDAEIAEKLGRSKGAIRHHRLDMDLRYYSRNEWSEEEIEIVKTHYPDTENKEILEMLTDGRTLQSLYHKAQDMGLEKTEAFMEKKLQDLSKNLQESGKAHRFEKGHTPYNKGMKQEEYMSPEQIEKTKATRFQKGHKPWNTLEDGAVTIRHAHEERGEPPYMWIRLSENNWMLYHRYRWEQEHGPIPDKHVLRCKSDNTLDAHPENWELISMAENARRNHNPEKVSEAMKEYWKNNPHPARDLSDNYVAGLLAGGDNELRDHIVDNRQDLIKVARANYKMKRAIREAEDEES